MGMTEDIEIAGSRHLRNESCSPKEKGVESSKFYPSTSFVYIYKGLLNYIYGFPPTNNGRIIKASDMASRA